MGKIISAKRLRIKIYVDMLFELSDSIFSHLIKNEFFCFETVANVDQSSFVLLSTYPIRKTYISMTYTLSTKRCLNSQTLFFPPSSYVHIFHCSTNFLSLSGPELGMSLYSHTLAQLGMSSVNNGTLKCLL